MTTTENEVRTRDFTDEDYWDRLGRKSVLRFFLLAALHEQPMHGYGIAGSVAKCCDGGRPTDAMIYPALKELQEGGYLACEVEPVNGRQRKVCRLTARGEQAYSAAAKSWLNFLPHLVMSINRAPGMSGPVAAVLSGCCAPDILTGEGRTGGTPSDRAPGRTGDSETATVPAASCSW